MNKLTTEKRCQVISALVEGNSIRSTVRMTGVAKNTIVRLLVDVGTACANYQDAVMRDLPCKRLELDEIWSFVYSKQKNIPQDRQGEEGIGDCWTWVAIDADTKLVPCWVVGLRDGEYATAFVKDLASRLKNRVQLTSDGHKSYLQAVDSAFHGDVDYAMLVKKYGKDHTAETRYSPPICTGCKGTPITGNPDKALISTSYVERQNLTMRMKMRRFTRLTNAFSKKIDNLMHAVSLHFMHYNFARIHQTLRATPAMTAGVADHLWRIEEIVALADSPVYNPNC